jgi:hypothetical protein
VFARRRQARKVAQVARMLKELQAVSGRVPEPRRNRVAISRS